MARDTCWMSKHFYVIFKTYMKIPLFPCSCRPPPHTHARTHTHAQTHTCTDARTHKRVLAPISSFLTPWCLGSAVTAPFLLRKDSALFSFWCQKLKVVATTYTDRHCREKSHVTAKV